MSEPSEVEARFDAEGKITLLSFTWRGSRLSVTGQGREWEAEDGRHFLVMTTGERIFELAYESKNNIWRVVKIPESKLIA